MLRRRGYTHEIPNTTHFQMPLNDAFKALAGTLCLLFVRFYQGIILHSLLKFGGPVSVSMDAFYDAQ